MSSPIDAVNGGEAQEPRPGDRSFVSAVEEAHRAASGLGTIRLPESLRTAVRFARPKVERLLQRLLPEQRAFNASILEAVRALARDWQEQGHRMRVRLDAAEQRLDSAERRLDGAERRIDGVESASDQLAAASQRLRETIDGLAERFPKEVLLPHIQAAMEPVRAQLDRMRWELMKHPHAQEGAARAAAPRTEAPVLATLEANAALEQLFVAGFSERFRGSRREVKEAVGWYAGFLRDAGAGTAERPIVDLGCGRGELLEVLREEGLVARGVECAQALVSQTRELGLEVDEGDAISYLRDAEAGSMGAITAIHVVEHLSFPDLLTFFQLAHRALAPGGVLVLETPNPDNLRVGARNFYLDPSHVRPLVPPLLQFIAESNAFQEATVHPLHPGGKLFSGEGPAAALAQQLNDLICGPQDYALTAVRAE